MNIIDALHDERFFKPVFKNIKTWHAWEVYLQTLFGLPIDISKDGLLFKEVTGLDYSSQGRFKESYVICGRRSGKSYISAIIACYLATFKDWSKDLAVGERGYIFIIANDKAQAKIVKTYITDILNSSASFRKLISKETAWEVELKNNVNIQIKTASFRTLRGYTLLAVILEEIAFWRSDESANPDREILAAVRPALATIPDSLLIGISTPYSKKGVLFEQFKKHYGKPGGPLIWKAPTEKMNPTINREIIERAFEEDPQAAISEWSAEWRKDIEALIPLELVETATIQGRYEVPKIEEVTYFAFTDPSGGRQDSFTLAISHGEEEKIVLDLIREAKPPFSPENVVKEYSGILKNYGILAVESDRYAGEWVVESFRKNGITVNPSKRSKSEIYLEFLPLISSGTVELLDRKIILAQLTALDRKTRPGGRDSIDNFLGPDDIANAVCGSCVLVASERSRSTYHSITYGGQTYEHGTEEDIKRHHEESSGRKGSVYFAGMRSSPRKEDIEIAIEEEVKKRAKEIYSKYGYVSPMGIAHSMGVSFEVVRNNLFNLGYIERKKNEFLPKGVDDLN
jgi:ribosomal protein S25